MSMCLYIARGAESELRELAEDAETLCGMGLDSMFGGPGGLGGSGGPVAGQSAQDKLARLEALVAQQPHLREALGQVMNMVGPQRTNPLAAATAATAGAAGSAGAAGATPGGGGVAAGLASIFGGLAGRAPPRPGTQPDRPPVVDLHKSWHMFHFLFTGRAEGGSPPGSLLMEGGEEVGEDLGYGPARLIGPADTAAFANFIGALSVDELKARLDGPRMAALGIYPGFEAVDAVREYSDDVEHYFPKLRDQLAAAAAAGEAVLVWLS
jgi:hypothetical protein